MGKHYRVSIVSESCWRIVKYYYSDAYVKASIIYKGKQMAKQKTAVQTGAVSPEFQEALTFDVPVSELEKTTLVLTVAHQDDDESAK